jgi:hypothetical protein
LTLGATGELFGLVFFDLLKIFMPRHPISGMKGSKPRTTDGDAQSTARRNFELNSVLDRNYKRHRNRLLDLKTKHEALALARERNQLIERELVLHQPSYLLVSMRQKLLSLSPNIAARFGREGKVTVEKVVKYTDQVVREILQEIINIPRCAEPDWMDRLEEEEGGSP